MVSSVLTIVDMDISELRDTVVPVASSVIGEDLASSECVELTTGRASEVVGNDGRESEVFWVSVVSVVMVSSVLTIVDVAISELRDTVVPVASSVDGEDVDFSEWLGLTVERSCEVVGNEGLGSEDVSKYVVSEDDSVVVVSSVLTIVDVNTSELRDTVVPDASSVFGDDDDPAECVALTLERASEVLGNEGLGSEFGSISVVSVDDTDVVVSSVLTLVDADTSELRDVAALEVSSVLREDADS